MSKVPRGLRWALGLMLVIGGAGGVWWLSRPEPPPPAEADIAEADEKDPSREETEDLMRQIGYVQ